MKMLRSYIKIRTLWNEISEYDGLVLYGAGDIAEGFITILEERDYQPLYCVVSDISKNPEVLNGIPVYDIAEKAAELRGSNILVFVSSLSERSNKKILDMLRSYEITNTLSASAYWFPVINMNIFWDMYMEKEYGWYISRIKSWYLEQYGTYPKESLGCGDTNKNKSKILFVVENFSARVVKIAKALKSHGKEVTLLLEGREENNPMWRSLCNILDKEQIEYLFFGPVEELLFLLQRNQGCTIHVFSSPWVPYIAYILVKLQNFIGSVVFENYDIANGFHTILDDEMLKLEQYCIENARGVSYREYSLEYLRDVLHFQIKGKSIRFWDYCSDEKEEFHSEDSELELSLCYVGGIEPEGEFPESPFGHLEFASQCEQNHCHFHIYPPDWDEKRYEEFIKQDETNPYFHFHKPVPNNKLAEEISKYDYGVSPVKDDIWNKKYSGQYTKEKLIYAGANKLFDYLDAGLPIITAIPQKISQYLEKKGVLINWTNGQYDFDYLRSRKKMMRENIPDVREELRIGNHIPKLIEFYESL